MSHRSLFSGFLHLLGPNVMVGQVRKAVASAFCPCRGVVQMVLSLEIFAPPGSPPNTRLTGPFAAAALTLGWIASGQVIHDHGQVL